MSDDTLVVIDDSDEIPTVLVNIPVNRMEEILDLIEDPLKPVSDINRIIAQEIASVTGEMALLTQTNAYKLTILKEQVRALRELAKTLVENEVLSKKDILNFDGPKFQYVFQEITSSFKKSMKDSGITKASTNEVLRNFRDIMAAKEVELRKATERVESTFISNKG